MSVELNSSTVAFDLSSCEREEIHISGAVQAYGYIVGLSADGEVAHISSNLLDVLTLRAEEVLGMSTAQLPSDLRKVLAQCATLTERGQRMEISLSGEKMTATQVSADSCSVIEFEPDTTETEADRSEVFHASLQQLSQCRTTESIFKNLVSYTRELLDYERVMAYRFEHTFDGTVIAEAKDESLEPFLGLRYPASDIPPQARAIFSKKLSRLIPDIDTTPSKIVSQEVEQPLDLTYANVRSVSPVHIEYLRNMGVRASLTLSIIVHGRLWGLLACHHSSSPKYLSSTMRAQAEVLTSIASLLVAALEEAAGLRDEVVRDETLAAFTTHLRSRESLAAALDSCNSELRALMNATGLASISDGEVMCWGNCPDTEYTRKLTGWLETIMHHDEIYSTNSLPNAWVDALSHKETACGVLAVRLSSSQNEETGRFAIWFRPELVSTVSWGGNPKMPVVIEDARGKISPRTSFAKWIEKFEGSSERWTALEMKAARFFRAEWLDFALVQKDKLLQETLRQNAIQQGKVELATRVLHDIGNALAPMSPRIAGRLGTAQWDETAQLSQLLTLLSQHSDGLDSALGAGKGEAVVQFITTLADSINGRQQASLDDSKFLAGAVSQIEQILMIQRQFASQATAIGGSESPLKDLIEQAVSIARVRAERLGVVLSSEIDGPIVVQVDQTNFIRLLLESIEHALASVTARPRKGEQGSVKLTARSKAEQLHLTVSDNGAGLPDELQTSKSQQEFLRSCRGKVEVSRPANGQQSVQTFIIPCAVR